MFANRNLLIASPFIALMCVAVSVYLIGSFGAAGFGRFSSKEFWSLYSGALVTGLVMAVMVGVMSTDNPNLEEPVLTMLCVGGCVFLGFAFIALFPACFLHVPKGMLARIATGIVGVPVLMGFIFSALFSIAEPFIKMWTQK